MEIYPPTDWTKHPLHVAALSGNERETARMLSLGADVNEHVFREGTPLHVAICHCLDSGHFAGQGHVAVVRLLLNQGANLHASRAFSGTPLHDAADRGHIEIAEILLSHGANINSKEEDHHRTPLHRAVGAGQATMVKFLIAQGADVNAVADFTLEGSSPRAYPDCGMTPLHIAAREGSLDVARQLVAAGAVKDIQVTTSHRRRVQFQTLTAFDLALHMKVRIEHLHEDRLRTHDEFLELLDTQRPPQPVKPH